MNREIKFRAWYPIEREMYEVASIDWFWGLVELQYWESLNNLLRGKLRMIVLMQFTGEVDSAGKEIYEGDIIIKKNHWNSSINYTNKWQNPKVVKFEGGKFTNLDYNVFEEDPPLVIGNVFENPELLE